MFAIQVEDAVSAMGSGVILKGSCDLTKYQIEPGICLYDLAVNEYIVSTVTLTEDSQAEILISDTKGKPADYFTGRVLTTLADVCILFQQSKSDPSLPDESFAEEVEEYNRVKELLYDLPFGESPPHDPYQYRGAEKRSALHRTNANLQSTSAGDFHGSFAVL